MTLTLAKSSTPPVPGGPSQYRVYTASVPVPGSGWTETVPAAEIWRLLALAAELDTSATVANREAQLIIFSGGQEIYAVPPVATQPAASARVYEYALGVVNGSGAVRQIMPLGDIPLVGGSTIFHSTVNLQAGDQWAAVTWYVHAYTK